MKPIAAYFGTSPITESQVPTEVSNGASDANIIQTLVHEPEESNQGSRDNILQASIQGSSRADIEPDPGLRKQIADYSTPEIRDAVRREYLKKGPCQPYGHDFPRDEKNKRVLREEWFEEFDWLEYSIKKNKAYCFHCYLFKQPTNHVKFGGNVFNQDGYKNWKKARYIG